MLTVQITFESKGGEVAASFGMIGTLPASTRDANCERGLLYALLMALEAGAVAGRRNARKYRMPKPDGTISEAFRHHEQLFRALLKDVQAARKNFPQSCPHGLPPGMKW